MGLPQGLQGHYRTPTPGMQEMVGGAEEPWPSAGEGEKVTLSGIMSRLTLFFMQEILHAHLQWMGDSAKL